MMVTYNRIKLTENTFNNLCKNTEYKPLNIVIVDNGSTDGTVQYLSEFSDKYKGNLFNDIYIHYEPKNRGIPIGRNIALKLAVDKFNSRWLCTLDNDVEVPRGWLTECIDVLKANPNYGMIGVNVEGKSYQFVTEKGKTFQCKPQGNLGTACMVFPLSLHKMIGFFNTEYIFFAHEDADAGLRTRALGLKLGYIQRMGKHIGEGENDQGEYREFKNEYHKKNLPKFHENARLYMTKKKSIYIPYKEE